LGVFPSEIKGSSGALWLLKAFCPVEFVLSMLADGLVGDQNGGYWLAVRAAKIPG
jgi:hypothetical protein